MTVTYACPACKTNSRAEVAGFPSSAPSALVDSRLRFATCPRCGQRNPAGLAGDDVWGRHTRVIMLGMSGFLAAATWLFPIPGAALTGVALIVPHLVGMVLRMRAGAPTAPGGLLTALHFGVALVAAAFFWPRAVVVGALAAFLVPLAQREVAQRAAWERGRADLRWLPEHPDAAASPAPPAG